MMILCQQKQDIFCSKCSNIGFGGKEREAGCAVSNAPSIMKFRVKPPYIISRKRKRMKQTNQNTQ